MLGPRKKPTYCVKNCQRQNTATGFVPDSISAATKVVLLKFQPTDDEVNTRQADISVWEKYAINAGLDPQTVGVSFMLRCYGKPEEYKNKLLKFQKTCRYWDRRTNDGEGKAKAEGGLIGFDPNIFIITFDTKQLAKADAFKIFFRKSFEMAKSFADTGYKPVILCGLEVAELVNPDLFSGQNYDRDTTFRSWVGHWWYGDWPFVAEEKQSLVKISNEARNKLKGL